MNRLKMLGKSNAAFPLLLCTLFLSWRTCRSGKILVVPLEGSHWVNMDIMLKALHAAGHSVDVVRSNQSWYIKDGFPHYNTITVPITDSFNQEFINVIVKKIINIEREGGSFLSFASLQLELFDAMSNVHGAMSNMAKTMIKDEDFMKMMKKRDYDLALVDPAWGAGTILAYALELPLVYNVRWTTSGEGHTDIAPTPLSYIPLTGSGLSDKMSFIQRVQNVLFLFIWTIMDRFVTPQYQAVCDEVFGPEVQYLHLLKRADLWLMRADFIFEFPRPTMPNVIYIGGFQCKPSKPLPIDLAEFVQNSGEHGFIIMSLGTFVSELPADVADKIAAAFAKLPQIIIWKHKGEKPKTLGNNTLIVDWMPQNDLLGHPKIKLFVAHGGTNGVQEAIYHGVPVIGLPIFYDQFDNLLRLKERGAAKILSLATVDEDDTFLKALQEVLTEPSYRMNMQRLSRLHRDTPMKPMDKAVFWIEFVMRHKGATHLRTESYKMPWYSYHSVDVYLFLSAVLLLILLTPILFIKYLCSRIRKNKVKGD